jgi:predicted nucleic acid-binding protein
LIVLDSSYLIAFHNAGDVHHQAAADVMSDLLIGRWGQVLLPEYVFLEVTTVIAARRGVAKAAEVGRVLLQAAEVEFVPCSDLFLDAFTVFAEQGEAGLSFVDAALVSVARRSGAKFIATFDRDFEAFPELKVIPGSAA